jgi:hypothetical protein
MLQVGYISMLQIGYISTSDQLSVFVHAERLNKINNIFGLSICTKTDNSCSAAVMQPISTIEKSKTICDKVTELA